MHLPARAIQLLCRSGVWKTKLAHIRDKIFPTSICSESRVRVPCEVNIDFGPDRVLKKSKRIAGDKKIWIIPRAYAYPFWYPIFLEGSALCHPPQALVFHLSRRTELLTAQGIGVLPRKRFVASVLGRRQREYLVTYVRQLAGGIKENFCLKVCFLRSAVARL